MPEDDPAWEIWNDYGKVSTGLTWTEAVNEVERLNNEGDAGPYYGQHEVTGRTIEP